MRAEASAGASIIVVLTIFDINGIALEPMIQTLPLNYDSHLRDKG